MRVLSSAMGSVRVFGQSRKEGRGIYRYVLRDGIGGEGGGECK